MFSESTIGFGSGQSEMLKRILKLITNGLENQEIICTSWEEKTTDGKATGVVHKFQDQMGHTNFAGSFKIMSDGIITRFTGLSKADWRNGFMKFCRNRI